MEELLDILRDINPDVDYETEDRLIDEYAVIPAGETSSPPSPRPLTLSWGRST